MLTRITCVVSATGMVEMGSCGILATSPTLQNSTLQNTWNCTHNSRQIGSLPPPANAESELRRHGERNVLAAVQRHAKNYTQNLQNDWRRQTQAGKILHHDGFYHYPFQRVQHILPGDHDNRVRSCNSCNHGYKFCVTFCSQFCSHGTALKEFTLFGTGKPTPANTMPSSKASFR